jgi:ribosome-binding protein aMBF1 (putative translation factor)
MKLDHGFEIVTNHLSGHQIRAARALLDWSAERLAKESGVSLSTIKRAEKNVTSISAVATAIHDALWKGGVDFVERGVTLRET